MQTDNASAWPELSLDGTLPPLLRLVVVLMVKKKELVSGF